MNLDLVAAAMLPVTFQVLEGVDKGRIFRNLSTPLTIGREEGNLLRLNDDRVSRFHAKVQQDNSDIILTDLESTNGTRVNGKDVQIRRLRPGDRIGVGRSVLLFGSHEEIVARMAALARLPKTGTHAGEESSPSEPSATVQALAMPPDRIPEVGFELAIGEEQKSKPEASSPSSDSALPPLPQKMTPAQAARLSEILDFFHGALASATENVLANEDGTEVVLSFADWQSIQAIEMLLARYVRGISEPESAPE